MKYVHMIPSLIIGVLLTSAAHATGYLKLKDVPGAAPNTTIPIGINDKGQIAGSYQNPAGHGHGFFGPINGTYTTFDVGTGGTEARGISNSGYITGFSNANSCRAAKLPPLGCVEFERYPGGAIVQVKKSGAQLYGVIQGINSSGTFVGDYATPSGTANGFSGRNGVYTAEISLPFPVTRTQPRAINGHGVVVGSYSDSGGTHGFVLKDGIVTVIDYPSPSQLWTFLEGINDQGTISGFWVDSTGKKHGFVLSADFSTFTAITPPGATVVYSWNINNAGEVSVITDVGGFIYCSKAGDKVCKGNNGNVHVAASHTVHATPASFRTFPCTNGCRAASAGSHSASKPQVAAKKVAASHRKLKFLIRP